MMSYALRMKVSEPLSRRAMAASARLPAVQLPGTVGANYLRTASVNAFGVSTLVWASRDFFQSAYHAEIGFWKRRAAGVVVCGRGGLRRASREVISPAVVKEKFSRLQFASDTGA